MDGQSISYFSEKDGIDVFVGVHPIGQNVRLMRSDITDKLHIKVKNQSSTEAEGNIQSPSMNEGAAQLNDAPDKDS